MADLADAGVSWATVSNMPLAQIEAYEPDGLDDAVRVVAWHHVRRGLRRDGGFMLSVFLRDGDDVYRTYSTTARGVDRVLFVNNILDLAPTGARRTGRTPRRLAAASHVRFR